MWHNLIIYLLIQIMYNMVSSVDNRLNISDCSTAPSQSMFVVCRRLQQWDLNARKHSVLLRDSIVENSIFDSRENDRLLLSGGHRRLSSINHDYTNPFNCRDLACLCPHFKGFIANDGVCTLPNGERLTRAIRREYRQLSDDERNRFHRVLRTLKDTGEYDRLGRAHADIDRSRGAHSGPAFLPWHREFLRRFEIALRLIDPSVALPYWDSTLDQPLPDSRHSILWTEQMWGETNTTNGYIINGVFTNWTTTGGTNLLRRYPGRATTLMSNSEVNKIFNATDIINVLAYTSPWPACPYRVNFGALEYVHSHVHRWIGGDMEPIPSSSNDPLFYLHHSFVDLIWERWRMTNQNRYQRETDYPPALSDCCNDLHYSNATMSPFDGLQNVNGLANYYTDIFYEYSPRPTCTWQNPNCGSQYLFCDRSSSQPYRCISKVKLGGRCDTFRNDDICLHSVCGRDGYCVAIQHITQTSTTTTTTTTMQLNLKQSIDAKVQKKKLLFPTPLPLQLINTSSTCTNNNVCCMPWSARGECSRNPSFMSKNCASACNLCQSSFNDSIIVSCIDRYPSCNYWRMTGECERRQSWMSSNCAYSCHFCAQNSLLSNNAIINHRC